MRPPSPIIALVRDGLSNREIAARLGRTVTQVACSIAGLRRRGTLDRAQRQSRTDWTRARVLFEAGAGVREVAAVVERTPKSVRQRARLEGWQRPQGHPTPVRVPRNRPAAVDLVPRTGVRRRCQDCYGLSVDARQCPHCGALLEVAAP